MVAPIHIWPLDDEAQARSRHVHVVECLERLGREIVERDRGHGLPTHWEPIIRSWLAGETLDPPEKEV